MSFVIVIVWVSRFKKTSPGHAAMMIDPPSLTPEDGYVSFAPVKSGSVYGPGKFYDYAHDYDHYIDEKAERRGCWVGKIYGLDTDRMMEQFLIDQKHPPTYSISNECATTVHRYLQIGGGDKFAGIWSRNVLGFWSPDDVEDYARDIVKKTHDLGSYGHKIDGAGTMRWPRL
jgi:hypothetical protein